jgi:hypothetical protein
MKNRDLNNQSQNHFGEMLEIRLATMASSGGGLPS